LALSGCQGGGSNPPPFNSGTQVPTSVTQSANVTPAGGSVTATLGTQSVTVRVPSGALSGPATVSLTVYGGGAAPRPLQSTQRKVASIGAHSVLLVEFSVSVSGATLLKPLQSTYNTAAAASGNIFRLAGFGTAPDDVDTVTWANNVATSDLNVAFSRMSLAAAASPGTFYAFYTEPSGEAGGVPGPVITTSTTSAQPIPMFGTATFTGLETETNGFPYLDPSFTYSVSDASLGSIDPSTGFFAAGAVDGAGSINATDPTAGRGNPHGGGTVTVSSQRPGNAGDVFSFTGTLSSTVQLVNRNATQPQTDTAAVTLNSTVTGFTPTPGSPGAGQNAVHSNEVDTYRTQTVTTGTDSVYAYALITPFAAGGPRATLTIKSSDAKDSNGSEYVTTYGAGNGLLDTLPQTTGAFGPNSAALTYVETDPAKFSRQRTTNGDGSYTGQDRDAFNDVQTSTVNSDLSASYDARQYSGLRLTMTAPSGGRIIVRIFDSAGNQLAAFNIPSWIPASQTQPSQETDVDNGSTAFPASCNVPAKYGTSGNQIVQTINRADTAIGNLETMQTTTYTAGTVGPVCIKMTDSVQTFYDLTGQNGFSALISGGTVPLELVSLSETLTLQSAKTSGGLVTQSTSRGAASATRGTSSISPSSYAPVAFAQARFQHAVREKLNWMQRQAFNRNHSSQGVRSL
jgi:hypothetical protein